MNTEDAAMAAAAEAAVRNDAPLEPTMLREPALGSDEPDITLLAETNASSSEYRYDIRAEHTPFNHRIAGQRQDHTASLPFAIHHALRPITTGQAHLMLAKRLDVRPRDVYMKRLKPELLLRLTDPDAAELLKLLLSDPIETIQKIDNRADRSTWFNAVVELRRFTVTIETAMSTDPGVETLRHWARWYLQSDVSYVRSRRQHRSAA
jgi:hypothetical protein